MADLIGGRLPAEVLAQYPVDTTRLATECVDGCVLQDLDHDCCAHVHGDCDGRGCERCWDGLLWRPW